jgi:hypothetical protein
VATNQNGLQSVEHYALKYSNASVKYENSIFFYVILDFFVICLLIFPLSFSLPSLQPFCVLVLFSVMIFYLYFLLYFMHYFLLFTFLLFFSHPTFLSFPSFLFLFTSSPFSPFPLSSPFACLLIEGQSLYTKQ